MGDTGEYQMLLLRKYLEQEEGFNPFKINLYRDCFLTTHYSVYHINKEGRISRKPKRPSIEDAHVRLIGGLDHETYRDLCQAYGWCERPEEITKEKVTDMIMKYGKHIQIGRVVAAVLKHDKPSSGKSDWIITSPVEGIEYV